MLEVTLTSLPHTSHDKVDVLVAVSLNFTRNVMLTIGQIFFNKHDRGQVQKLSTTIITRHHINAMGRGLNGDWGKDRP